MNKIEIIPKNIELTKELKEYIKKRMSYFEKFFGSDEDSFSYDFRIGRESAAHKNGNIFFAEISIETPGKLYGARADNQVSPEAAVDKLKDELKRKITSSKEKKVAVKRREEIKAKKDLI